MSRPPPRLYVDAPLSAGIACALDSAQGHYLRDVMRLRPGDAVTLFNGRDGEWRCRITELARKAAAAEAKTMIRPQPPAAGPRLLFAPVKKTGTDFIVEKATELGAARLTPVVTDFTDAGRANAERLRARAVEAAEQCGRLDVPTVDDAVALTEALAGWPADTPLIVADETGGGSPVLDALGRLAADATPAFVIGPQGGFSETELAFLRGLPFSTSVDLGPRVLRAETAATAALTCWQALRGDWTPPPGAT